MPLLILHCRTRLFLAIIQQGSIPGGSRTYILVFPLQEQSMNFTLFPTKFQYYRNNNYTKKKSNNFFLNNQLLNPKYYLFRRFF